jgi:hypothetical protein
MEEITDPKEIAASKARRKKFERNFAWLQVHAAEVYEQHRGKCLCIAGEELYVADTPQAAISLATAAHPEDDGWFFHYVPQEKVARVYECVRPRHSAFIWSHCG